jgi:hypothetical protein
MGTAWPDSRVPRGNAATPSSLQDPHAALEAAWVSRVNAADDLAVLQRAPGPGSGPLSGPSWWGSRGRRPAASATKQRLHGLEVRRTPSLLGFDELSAGMREQLNGFLHLSMAEVLMGGHDGCLPLVFDDAFTQSNPARLEMLKGMLTTAAARGLKVVLLSCDPGGYGDLAAVVRLPRPEGSAVMLEPPSGATP